MAEVCEVTGADVQALATALSHDPRIGGRFLRPGLGFGGGRLPKDIRAYIHRANELGVGQAVSFLREVDAINQRRRQRTVDLVRSQAGGAVPEVGPILDRVDSAEQAATECGAAPVTRASGKTSGSTSAGRRTRAPGRRSPASPTMPGCRTPGRQTLR
jgi:UDP-glucose/GDP-mannose dehydrogenase family, central domain